MSRRIWNSVEDRRKLAQVDRLFQDVFDRARAHHISHQNDYDFDSDLDQSMDDDDNVNVYSHVLREVSNIATHQYNRVHNVLEDDTIEFGQTKTIADFNESDCIMYFRFLKEDLEIVAQQLWPRLSEFLNSDNQEIIQVGGSYTAHYETCLCLYLFKMSHPCRLRCDCEKFFGIRKSKLSRMMIFFGDAMYRLAQKYLLNPSIWKKNMPYYAEIIEEKCGGIFPHMWGFIDCTIRRTCVPIRHQEVLYTRYKRCHGIKFQSVVTPDGYIACLSGPFSARRHDVRILRESRLLDVLQRIMPEDAEEPIYYLYGDLAYEHRRHLFSGFRNAAPNTARARFNHEMSKCRIVVEWGFSNVLRRWQYLDFTREMKVLKVPIGQYYTNCVFLTNILNCFYGGAINKYFDSEPMSLHEYLGLIDEL